ARELGPVLNYAKWDNFRKVIDKAMLACKNSSFEVADHFPDLGKMVKSLLQSRLLKLQAVFLCKGNKALDLSKRAQANILPAPLLSVYSCFIRIIRFLFTATAQHARALFHIF
ncbi:MAG: hypothetical protein Q4C63_03710, partial [Eubacteriales bacterium]|nr:hypothetical protein [Eubacteriales bacterium]